MSFPLKFLAVPAALTVVGSFAWLNSAAAFDGGFDKAPQLAQAAPPAAMPPAAGGGPDRPQGREMRMMRNFSPKDMCQDQVARRIGNRAYLKSRLDLRPEQMALWNNFEKAADEATTKDKARCASLPAEIKTPPSYVDRMTIQEDMMKARLETIQAVKPSLQALYASLTPEQKAILDKPRGMGGMMHRHGPHGPG